MRGLVRRAIFLGALGAAANALAAKAGAPRLSLLIRADPVRVPSADRLKIFGDVAGRPGTEVRDSTLVVRDASGRAVFEKADAFLFQWTDGRRRILSPAEGYSGPRLPASLPRGRYTAVWTVDGLASNAARFAVGPGKPRYLTIEGLRENHAGACVLVHVYVWEPRGVDFCRLVFGVKLVVDGQERPGMMGCMYEGPGGPAGGGLSFAYRPRELGVTGRHKVSARYRDHRSEEIELDCRPAPKF